jgi:hypothetical protein
MAKQQLHKRLSDEQVKLILEHYLSKEVSLVNALDNLQIKRARFFRLLKRYQDKPDTFTILPPKKTNAHSKVSAETEKFITEELTKEQQLIFNKNIPIKFYNYSAVRDDILNKHQVKVSLPTIITRAKQQGFYVPKPERKTHDREVITNFAGELIQHDSSLHQWSPFMDRKMYLITSIDDYSRLLLFAELFLVESSWWHISAIESVVLAHGSPLKYYPDQHSIFRFVKERDKFTPWHTAHKFTDDVETQFKQVLKDCGADLIYALSPNAKGKIERPYQWLQDRIVRTCAKEHITEADDVRKVLKELVYQYNNIWVHSTTKQIPAVRFDQAIHSGQSLFKPFAIKPPFTSSKDIFALRDQRTVDNYRKISFHNLQITIPGVPQRNSVDLRVVPNTQPGLAEVRVWFKDKLVATQLVGHADLKLNF